MGRRSVLALLGAAAAVLVLLSPHVGRAEPTGNYRPSLPPDALATGCWPLPGDVVPPVPYVVRWDGDIATSSGARRRWVAHVAEVAPEVARDRVVDAFDRAGFTRVPEKGAAVVLRDDTGAVVRVTVVAVPGADEDTLVRGILRLDLPVVRAARDDEVCAEPKSSKRWSPAFLASVTP